MRRIFPGILVTAIILTTGISVTHCYSETQQEEAPLVEPAGAFRDSLDNRACVEPRDMVLVVGAGGRLQGSDDLVLQAGIDYLDKMGGGVLQLLPGEYLMRNTLRLRSHVHILGNGADTILRKAANFTSALVRDAEWYEYGIEVADGSGFSSGCGVMVRDARGQCLKATVKAREGNRLFLDRRLGQDFRVEAKADVALTFPVLSAEDTEDVRIENLVIDGNKLQNEKVSGNSSGGVFLLRCKDFVFRNVTVHDYNGDGFSFQICDDLVLEACVAENNATLGFHLGSGSQRSVVRNCTSRGNSQGIYFCWGVNDALIENTTCAENSDYGISLGHRDSDNRIMNCTIERNGKAGIFFYSQESVFFGAHRNAIIDCQIRDNGPEDPGVGIAVDEPNQNVTIKGNTFEDTGLGRQRTALFVHPNAVNVEIADNKFVNQAVEVSNSVPLKRRIKELVGR
jgi:hypothetical protein